MNNNKEPWITLKNGARVHPSWLEESIIEKKAFDAFAADNTKLTEETRKSIKEQIKQSQADEDIDLDINGYTSQIRAKIQAIKEKLAKQSMPKIGENVKIIDINKNPASMTLTVSYNNGTSQTIDLVSLPEANELTVGMTWREADRLLAGAISGTQSSDPSQARAGSGVKQQWKDIYLKQEVDKALDGRVHPVDLGGKFSLKLDSHVFVDSQLGKPIYIDPTGDPLKEQLAAASNTVAAMDEAVDSPGVPLVYKHPRYPSKAALEIINDAIELIKEKKHIPINILSGKGNILTYDDPSQTVHITYSTDFKDKGKRAISEVKIPHRAFDRLKHTIDDYARLRGRLDTDTYITLRIAYILLQTAKLKDVEAKNTTLDIIEVIGHNTRDLFKFQ